MMRTQKMLLVIALCLVASLATSQSLSLGTLVTDKGSYDGKELESIEVQMTGAVFQKALFGDRYSVLVQDPSNQVWLVRLDVPGPVLAREKYLGTRQPQVLILNHVVFHRGWLRPSLEAGPQFSVTDQGNP